MEKELFSKFMKIRFPHISKSNYYYTEWKERFTGNPFGAMDKESTKVFQKILIDYAKTLKIGVEYY